MTGAFIMGKFIRSTIKNQTTIYPNAMETVYMYILTGIYILELGNQIPWSKEHIYSKMERVTKAA